MRNRPGYSGIGFTFGLQYGDTKNYEITVGCGGSLEDWQNKPSTPSHPVGHEPVRIVCTETACTIESQLKR